MASMKNQGKGARLMALSLAAMIGAGLAHRAAAATSLYFLPGGVSSGNTYSWDGPTNWSTASTSGSANTSWAAGDFARFNNATTYTVTVGADESMAGMYTTVSGSNLTINQAAGTSGDLNVVLGTGTGSADNAAQGFIAYGPIVINAPIVGAGGVNPQFGGSGAALSLFGNNTYSGGTLLTSSSTLIYFNNSNSFGTGAIYTAEPSGAVAPLLSSGGALVTLANNWVVSSNGGGVNFGSSANTPVTLTGTVSLGTNAFVLKNNGNSTAPLTVAGAISGSGNLTVSGANGGTTTFSGSNSYTGTTTIGVTGATGITLKLGAASTIANTSGITLAGGTLNPGGFNQDMSLFTPLAVSANSKLDYSAGASEVDFANSSAQTWAGTLNLTGWDPSMDKLRFGTDSTGLTAAQLGEIEFNGTGLGSAGLDANGYVVATPEPSAALLLLGAPALLATRRRRRDARKA